MLPDVSLETRAVNPRTLPDVSPELRSLSPGVLSLKTCAMIAQVFIGPCPRTQHHYSVGVTARPETARSQASGARCHFPSPISLSLCP